MPSLSLKQKSYLILTLIFLLIFTLALSIRASMNNIQEAIQIERELTEPLTEATTTLVFDVVQIQQWLTDISATRGLDGLNDGFDSAAIYVAEAQLQLETLNQLLPEYSSLFDEIEQKLASYYTVGQTMANAYIDGGPASGNKIMANFDEASENLQLTVKSLVDIKDTIATDTNEKIAMATTGGNIISNISFIFSFLLPLVLAVVFNYILIKPIEALKQVFSTLNAEQANLLFRFKVKRRDELGHIQHSFNQFLEKIEHLANQVNVKTVSIAEEVHNLEAISQNTRTRVSEQKQQVSTLSAAMEELSATSNEVTSSTNAVAEQLQDMQNQVGNSVELSAKTMNANESVASKISQSAVAIKRVEEQSNQIVGMVDSIEEIADQTNLLALNAAIEAARAGDHGRGFAVVADEVRTLASKTQESTEQIKSIIHALQSSANTAAGDMVICEADTNECVQFSIDSQKSLESVNILLKQINDMTAQTAEAMSQQTEVINSNTDSLSHIYNASTEADEGAASSYESVNLLNKNIDELQLLVEHFSGQQTVE